MPLPVSSTLPKPMDWMELEKMTVDVLTKMYGTPHVTRHGRQGQAQNGVDVYLMLTSGDFVGAQSKLSDLTLKDVEEECKKAKTFTPSLHEFIVVTTMDKNATFEEELRLFSQQLVKQDRLFFRVLFWEDITSLIVGDEELLHKYYPGWKERPYNLEAVKTLIQGSDLSDWKFDSETRHYIYVKDVRLVIKKKDEPLMEFEEEWTKLFADKKAYWDVYTIYYGSTPIKTIRMVAVDGFRSSIPLPKRKLNNRGPLEELLISEGQYKMALIVNRLGKEELDSRLNRAHIIVVSGKSLDAVEF